MKTNKKLNNVFNGFGEVTPTIDIKRSIIPMNPSYETSFNLGELVPICEPIETIAGDGWSVSSAELIHMTSLKRPIFGNINLDTYYFFVPMRLLWENWEVFFGAKPGPSAWNDETITTETVPTIKFDRIEEGETTEGVGRKSLAAYFGIPYGFKGLVSHLPFRAYAKIVNDWFMNQNVENPQNDYYKISGITHTKKVGRSSNKLSEFQTIESICNNGSLWTCYKYADQFTRALPAPQKYKPVTMNLEGLAPIVGDITFHETNYPIQLGSSEISYNRNTLYNMYTEQLGDNETGSLKVESDGEILTGKDTKPINETNLVADLSQAGGLLAINALETAIALERMLTAMARAGSNRYIEVLKALYGVAPQDFRLQRAEYIGGHRTRIQINDVPQTSGTITGSNETPGAYLYAYSKTGSEAGQFHYECQEPGYIMSLCVARQQHLYSNGLSKMWNHKTLLDFFNPNLNNIPEQPIDQSELYASESAKTGKTFGYQEAWYEYRYMPSRVTGMLNPNINGSLNNWSIADKYDSAPTLSMEFLKETPDYLDRCLAYTSDEVDQFVASFYFKMRPHRNMSAYSMPDIINHG